MGLQELKQLLLADGLFHIATLHMCVDITNPDVAVVDVCFVEKAVWFWRERVNQLLLLLWIYFALEHKN